MKPKDRWTQPDDLDCGCYQDPKTGEWLRLCPEYRNHTDAIERAAAKAERGEEV